MYRLAKGGFTQSYTYFAWRHTKRELTEYFEEITKPPVSDFFRPNAWPNTPDILTEYLQYGGRPAFAAVHSRGDARIVVRHLRTGVQAPFIRHASTAARNTSTPKKYERATGPLSMTTCLTMT
jgi:hypothetical protein